MHAIVDAASVTSRGDAAAMADTATTLLTALAVGLVAGVAIGLAMVRIRRRTRHAIPAGHHDELLELADAPDLGFVRFNVDLTATGWNRGMEAVLDRLTATDRRTKDARNWWIAIHPEDRPRLRTTLRGLRPLQSTSCDFRMRTTHDRWWSMRGAAHRRSDGTWTILFRDDTARASVERRSESAGRLRRTVDIAVEMLATSDDIEQTMCELLALIGDELDLPGIGWFEVDADARCRRIASWSPGRSPATSMTMPTTLTDDTSRRLRAGRSILERERCTDRLIAPIRIHEHFDSILVADFVSAGDGKDEVALVFGRFCEALGRRFEHEEMKRERESFARIRSSLERSEVVLQLAGGLRHDFNNAAFAIKGRISLLLQRTDDAVVTGGLEEIREAIDGSSRLIDRFVPRATTVERPIPIPIRTELADIANTVKRLVPRRLDLTFDCDDSEIDDGLVLEAAPNALQRILLDLVVNSRDAIRARGRIRISARRLASDRIEIRVDDDGPGIPRADRERFLEPFESGPSSTGPGIGLARCHRSVTRMGGRFELTSSPLGGLGARLVLPVSAGSLDRRNERPATAEGDARMPRLTLVVEDDAVVREVIKAHLEQAGTVVIDAGEATDVEAMLEADHDIEMLVMDIDLPRRSGIDCISALRAEGDRTPCVLVTGGAADPPPLERTRLLRKPFEMEPLISTIRDLLAECESDPVAERRGG